jgi:hypothetical protein
MYRFASPSRGLKMVLLSTIAAAFFAIRFAQLSAQEAAVRAEAEPSKLAADLIGAWSLELPPNSAEPGTRLKFFTGKHWAVTNYDEDGKVTFHHGGTYTLDGDQYTENVKYATEETVTLIGQTFKFKIKVEGDKYSQEGVGNPYTEEWTRAK